MTDPTTIDGRHLIGAALTDLRSLLATYLPGCRTVVSTAGADVAPTPAR